MQADAGRCRRKCKCHPECHLACRSRHERREQRMVVMALGALQFSMSIVLSVAIFCIRLCIVDRVRCVLYTLSLSHICSYAHTDSGVREISAGKGTRWLTGILFRINIFREHNSHIHSLLLTTMTMDFAHRWERKDRFHFKEFNYLVRYGQFSAYISFIHSFLRIFARFASHLFVSVCFSISRSSPLLELDAAAK